MVGAIFVAASCGRAWFAITWNIMLSLTPSGQINFSVLDLILRFWSVLAERTRGLTGPYLSSARSSDIDTHKAEHCLKLTVSIIGNLERCTNSLYFNQSLCERFVTKYLRQARELLEERESEILTYSEECAATLTALLTSVKDAESLIYKHCRRSNWIGAAVELVENTYAFAEVILDLKWYMHALQIAIEYAVGTPRSSRQKIWELQRVAMGEYGTFFERWESECKQLGLHKDREVLLSKLKVGSGDRVGEVRTLGLYLAQKLWHQDQLMHAGEALDINLDLCPLRYQGMLGRGAYGQVYKVQWLGMSCAVKEIGGRSTIDGEVKILSKLQHPNIIQLYGYSLNNGKLYLIMELMDANLWDYIEKHLKQTKPGPPFSLLVAIDTMLQIAKGMRYLHSKKMAHRDLKGGNILVKPSENQTLRSKGYLSVKLTDFGMAKANLKYSTCTPQSTTVGTRVWKAPELFSVFHSEFSNVQRTKHYPFAADVYSYAMVCYEILCGKIPFSDVPIPPVSSFYAKVKRGERPELPSDIVPADLAEYIKKCWHTEPCIRPDFVDICKRMRHFRDSLLQINAYIGWELKPDGSKRIVQEPSTIDENEFIDVNDWTWVVDYKDIVRVDKLPGGSGFAEVWRAQWKSSQRVLAKYVEATLIDNDANIANFKQEIELLVKMQHPNLVPYIGATQQAPFVVFTELAEGVTLRQYLDSYKEPLSQLDGVSMAFQIALGMASLHGEEVTVIHGELSPDCILIHEQRKTARVADFGMRSFKKAPFKWHPRSYRASPEQHEGLPLHTSADVFSFGTILYEIYERDEARHFWKRKKVAEDVRKGKRPELKPATHYPKGMKTLIQNCWAHDWQERPNFKLVVADLQTMMTRLSRSTPVRRCNSRRR